MRLFISFFVVLFIFTSGCGRPPAQAPILAKSDIYVYGNKLINYEGKIFNPNPYGIKDVRVIWRVYPKIETSWSGRFYDAGFEDYCFVEFAYIPAKTSFDFATNKIKIRDEETMHAWGSPEEVRPSSKAPDITFAPEH